MPGKEKKGTTSSPFINKAKALFKNIPFVNLIYISFVLIGINLLGVVLFNKSLPPEVPLYYGLAEGQEQLASSLELTIPSLVSLAIAIVNLFLALILKDKFLKQALIITAFVATIFSTITTVKIAMLVGSF